MVTRPDVRPPIANRLLDVVLLCVPFSAGALATSSARGQSGPSEITLRGVIHDFRSDHDDFDIASGVGFGQYMGLTELVLGPDRRPVHTGAVPRVESQWTDGAGNAVAPHLHTTNGRTPILVDERIDISQGDINSFDSALGGAATGNQAAGAVIWLNSTDAGALGLTNNAHIEGSVFVAPGGDPDVVITDPSAVSGITGALPAPFAMPTVEEPSGMGPSAGDVMLLEGTITGALHYDALAVERDNVVQVAGATVILCEGDLNMANNSHFDLLPGATLDLYVKGSITMVNNATINGNTATPAHATVSIIGDGTFTLQNRNRVYARLVAPDATLDISNNGSFGGTVAVNVLTMRNGSSGLHFDAPACAALDGAAGEAGPLGHGRITSADSFDQWFRAVLGTNISARHRIRLTNDGSGVWEYLNDEFYPIDGRLFGNEGQSHNASFTFSAEATFVYEGCGDQFLEFEGTDDVWVFIDDQLVIDLGGVRSDTTARQRVNLDHLALTEGTTHRLSFFHAQRCPLRSIFRLRTNIPFAAPIGSYAMVTSPTD